MGHILTVSFDYRCLIFEASNAGDMSTFEKLGLLSRHRRFKISESLYERTDGRYSCVLLMAPCVCVSGCSLNVPNFIPTAKQWCLTMYEKFSRDRDK